MANDVTELRDILFDAIRGVKDGTMDKEKADTIASLSQVLINSAKTEVDYIKATGGVKSTKFLSSEDDKQGGYVHRIGQRAS